MSAVSYALQKTILRIPLEILNEAFLKPLGTYFVDHASIADQILYKVFYPRVQASMDVRGGTEVFIDTSDLKREQVEQFTTVFRVPKSKTDGRSITSVYSVNFLNPNSMNQIGSTAFCGRGELGTAASALLNSIADIPPVSSAAVSLIAENTILVRYTHLLPAYTFIRCRLAYDDQLSAIPVKAYDRIAEALFLATKAYIWRQMVVELDRGKISGGSELGAFKHIIDRWESADDEYETYVKEILGVTLAVSDVETHRRFLRMQAGGYR